jgi:hypothetical protein
MMDPSEISAMASQIMPDPSMPVTQQPIPPQQASLPAPRPEDMMAMMGMQPGGMPQEGGPGVAPMGPGGPIQGGPQQPTKPASIDLVPPGLKEEVAKYAAQQQVQMSKQLLSLAGPESDAVPAGKKVLMDLWNKRKEGVSDEQIQAWKAEGKKPAWILANSYPGRYAVMAMGHWRPNEKNAFALKMKKMMAGEGEGPSGQSYDPVSVEAAEDEDPTPALSF